MFNEQNPIEFIRFLFNYAAVQEELVEGSDQNATKSFIIDTDQFLTLPAGYQYYDPLNAFVSFVDYSVFLNLLYGDQLM